MDRKKMLILILALVVLVGGGILVARQIKNQANKEQLARDQKAFADKFVRDMQAAKNKATTGTVMPKK